MTPEQIAADLRVAAQRATSGPWSAKRHSAGREPVHILTWPDTSKGGVHTRRLDSEFNGLFHKHDAEFIAAANPAAILALLDHIAQVQSKNVTLRQVLSECATAVGATAAPQCSVEFLVGIPAEIRARYAQVRASTIEEARQTCAAIMIKEGKTSMGLGAYLCEQAMLKLSKTAAPNEEKST